MATTLLLIEKFLWPPTLSPMVVSLMVLSLPAEGTPAPASPIISSRSVTLLVSVSLEFTQMRNNYTIILLSLSNYFG